MILNKSKAKIKTQQPKDLGIKIGSELEVFWTTVRDTARAAASDAKNTILLQSKVVEMAEAEIQKEKDLNTSKKKI